VYDKLRTQGYSYQNLALSNGSGEELARFWNGSESSYNFNALRIHRKKVQNALLEETRAQGIEIFYDMKLDRIIDDSETGVRLEFENGTVITADLVVGADGIHSRVRPAVSSVEPIYSGYFGITGLMGGHQLDKSLENFHLPNMFFGRTGFMAIMPSSFDGTEVGFFSTMEIAERTRDEWEDLFHKPEKIRDILTGRFTDGSWPALVRNICRDVPATTLASWP
jgi:2-polyprenyl-6-methoxyphenol hydroxylase-like FAD-dependent oxidoreductase